MRRRLTVFWALVAAVLVIATVGAGAAGSSNAPLRLGTFSTKRGGPLSLQSPSMAGLQSAISTGFPGATFVYTKKVSKKFTLQVNAIALWVGTGPNSAITPLKKGEQKQLLAFVKAGGTALLFTDNDTFDPNANTVNASFLAPFGLAATGTLIGGQFLTLSGGTNPVANGPFGTIASISTFYPGWFTALGSSTLLGTLDANGEPGVAYLPAGALGSGSGAVVFFSDMSFLIDGNRTADDTTAVLNALSLAH